MLSRHTLPRSPTRTILSNLLYHVSGRQRSVVLSALPSAGLESFLALRVRTTRIWYARLDRVDAPPNAPVCPPAGQTRNVYAGAVRVALSVQLPPVHVALDTSVRVPLSLSSHYTECVRWSKLKAGLSPGAVCARRYRGSAIAMMMMPIYAWIT
jgi:hypothetical protein